MDLSGVVTDNTKESKVKLGDTGVQIAKNISKQITRVVDEESISLTLNGKKILPDKKSLNFSQPRKVCTKGQTLRDGFCRKCTLIQLTTINILSLKKGITSSTHIFLFKCRCFNQNSLALHC